MVGKRVILLKRPAVLCAAVFVLGIFLARYSGWTVAAVAGGLFAGILRFLQNLRKGRRRVSVADRLLLLAPVCLVFGWSVMTGAEREYERNAGRTECIKKRDGINGE